jgi:hypothetical protein
MERIETADSVQAYFVFFGMLYILMYHDPTQGGRGIVWLPLLGLLQGIFYLSVGLVLRVLLNRAAWLISSVLVAHLSYCVLYAFSRLFNEGQAPPVKVIFRLVTAIFLILYVLRNVERLAAAKQNGAEETGRVAPASTDA